MNDPQPEGRHGKPHRTTKILSDAWRRGGCVAGWGAHAAGGDAAGWRTEFWHATEGRTVTLAALGLLLDFGELHYLKLNLAN
jgi:hypothetical protein